MQWGKLDDISGNQKPKFANTANVFGVTATEKANTRGQATTNTTGKGVNITHTGWVQFRIGEGPVKAIGITSPGSGINSEGFLVFTGGGGTGANATYTIANVQNVMQGYSSNNSWNVINSVILTAVGAGFNCLPTISTAAGSRGLTVANTINSPSFVITLGGRAGRISSETLVAINSITGDSSDDNVFFTGI